MKQPRLYELDILRALAIALVVFAHFPALATIPIDPAAKFWAAKIGLSLFIFVSGFVIFRNNYSIRNRSDVLTFYRKRLARVYPLYLLIMVVYISLQYITPTIANTMGIHLTPVEIIINLLGLQGIANVQSFGVLWFVGLILVYYAIYPLLMLTSRGHPTKILAIVTGLIFVFGILHFVFGLIINQMIPYFVVFLVGILASKVFLYYNYRPRFKSTKAIAPLLFIAGVSYSIYLTHMLILTALALPQVTALQTDLLLIFAGIPIILGASYLMTRIDRIRSNWKGLLVAAVAIILISGVALSTVSINPKAAPTSVNLTGNNTTITESPSNHQVTAKVQKTYIVYYFTMAAPCPAGLQMNKDIQNWAPNHKNVEFHFLSTESKEATSFNVRLSPTTVLIDRASGKVVKEWIGVFDLSELTSATK